jgi:phosphoserine phosphatase
MSQLFLATFSGKDRPGITSEITGVLARHDVAILDIAQAVVQNLLSLSIVFEGESGQKALPDLEELARSQKLKLEHRGLGAAEPPSKTPLYHYAVTLIAETVSAQALHEVTAALARRKTNIDVIKRLSEGAFGCVEMIVSSREEFSEHSRNALKKELLAIAKKVGVDIALQAEGLYRRAKRLVVLDMDSTLIQAEVIDELARFKGVYDQVSAITHQAMNGKMDYDESLRERMKLLKGTKLSELDRVFDSIQLTPGAEELIAVLKKLGYKTALISGGFSYVADRLKSRLGIDFVYANQLEIENGALTGNVIPPIVNARRKADLLDVIAQQERIELDQVIAVGDGANDLLMLEKAGLGIAFNAKPTVCEKADLSINQKNLSSILYLLGLSERELAAVKS